MKTSFTNITDGLSSKPAVGGVCFCHPEIGAGDRRISVVVGKRKFLPLVFRIATICFLFSDTIFAFQLETPEIHATRGGTSDFEMMESGLALPTTVAPTFSKLAEGRYQAALEALTPEVEATYPWLRTYLEGLVPIAATLIHHDSKHFDLYTPPGQEFLADMALPSLEKTANTVERLFGQRPTGRIRVEIYPTKKAFSAASTLSMETLERSGAIGICKFHRLMILSPRALPLGYRWLDALSHEYLHLNINEVSHAKAELWLHEGTARYFETAYRSQPPVYLTPQQKTALLDAQESDTLIPFARMSPSMVYLKDQKEVSLAFAQVSYAVDVLIQKKSLKKFVAFLKSLRNSPFQKGFKDAFGWDLKNFSDVWMGTLQQETWPKTKGALSDEVQFEPQDENEVVGADVQGRLRIADRMRRQGYMEAALIEYEKALIDEPDNAVLLLKAAKTHLILNQPDLARIKLMRATEKNPNYITTHIELAKLLPAQDALLHYEEANAINPFDPSISEGLIEVYKTLGRGEDARHQSEIHQLLIP